MILVQLKGPPKITLNTKAALRLLEVPQGQRGAHIWWGVPPVTTLCARSSNRFRPSGRGLCRALRRICRRSVDIVPRQPARKERVTFGRHDEPEAGDRKSTRLTSSH